MSAVMDIGGGLVGSLKTPDLLVTRRTAGAITNGIAAAPSEATFTIEAVVQPVTGRELQSLPEGMRTEQVVSIHTTSSLRTANEAGGLLPDHIDWQGATYQVRRVEDWSDQGGYYLAHATRVEAS